MFTRSRLAGLLVVAVAALLAARPGVAQEIETDIDSIVQDRVDRVVDGATNRAEEVATQAMEDRDTLAGRAHDQDENLDTNEQATESGRDDGGANRAMHELGAGERAEHDERGFPVRRSELLGIDLNASTLVAAQAHGFRIMGQQSLRALDHNIVHLRVPEGISATAGRKFLRELEPGATIDLVHYYGLGFTAGHRGEAGVAGKLPTTSTKTLTVGMIDTAVSAHEALARSIIRRWPSGNQDHVPAEHGTAVASLLAREGNATIFAANIFRGPLKHPFTSAEVIVDALEWLIASNVRTVNVSLAGPRNAVVDRLVLDAIAKGHTFVAAAGNDGPSALPSYPAALPGVIAVTAVDGRNRIYRYANRGRYISVAALGVDVIAARAGGGMAHFSGTSFAAPHIAGWVARCRTAGGTASQCSDRLRHAARRPDRKGFDDVYGFGVID